MIWWGFLLALISVMVVLGVKHPATLLAFIPLATTFCLGFVARYATDAYFFLEKSRGDMGFSVGQLLKSVAVMVIIVGAVGWLFVPAPLWMLISGCIISSVIGFFVEKPTSAKEE